MEVFMKRIMGYEMHDILALVGVTRKRSFLGAVLPALGLIAAGVAVGAWVGLIFAPSSGRHLRGDLQEGLRQGVGARLDQMRGRIQRERKARSNANAAPTTQSS
jgi:hypothetical protein